MISEEALALALLASMGVDKYEAGVVGVVLEQMHRSVQTILSEAREAAIHAGRDSVTVEDLELVDDLAAEDGYCAAPLPSREAMFDLARSCNARPLRMPDGHGLRLPPNDCVLTGRCYQLAPKDLGEATTQRAAPLTGAPSTGGVSSVAGLVGNTTFHPPPHYGTAATVPPSSHSAVITPALPSGAPPEQHR